MAYGNGLWQWPMAMAYGNGQWSMAMAMVNGDGGWRWRMVMADGDGDGHGGWRTVTTAFSAFFALPALACLAEADWGAKAGEARLSPFRAGPFGASPALAPRPA